MDLWFYRLGKTLVPADEESEAALQPIAQGEAILVQLKRERNLRFHKKYWALIDLIFRNQEKFPTKNHMHVAVKLAAGWFDPYVMLDGTTVYVPRSIAFSAMDESEFTQFYGEAVEAIIRVLPQFDAQFLLNAVVEFAPR